MKKGKILIILLVAVLMLLPACNNSTQEATVVHDGGSSFPIDKVSPEWDSVKLGLLNPFEDREEFMEKDQFGGVFAYPLGTSMEAIITMYQTVFSGMVLGFDFEVDEERNIYNTIYYIEPDEVFRGAGKTNDDGLIALYLSGGRDETYMEMYTNTPCLNVGDSYLFAGIDPITMGSGEGTNNVGWYTGGAVYTRSAMQGLTEAGEDDEVGDYFYTPFFYNQDGEGTKSLSHTELVEIMEKANAETPVPTDSEMRKKYVDRWRYTIDVYVTDGRMTQEEYDEAKAWLDAYEFYTGE